jgi:hypothetical protein
MFRVGKQEIRTEFSRKISWEAFSIKTENEMGNNTKIDLRELRSENM